MRYKFWSFYSTMPKNKRLRHGVGAKILVYKAFPHLQPIVAVKYTNARRMDVLHGVLAVHQGEKTASRKRQSCILMHHDNFYDGTSSMPLHSIAR